MLQRAGRVCIDGFGPDKLLLCGACQTLRIAIGNLLRGGSRGRGGDSIKPQLAQHLGIQEARVAKYLAEHCVVRWLQLDEGASILRILSSRCCVRRSTSRKSTAENVQKTSREWQVPAIRTTSNPF